LGIYKNFHFKPLLVARPEAGKLGRDN
jgi:hypothetical protein